MRIAKYKTLLVKEQSANYQVIDKSASSPQIAYDILTQVFYQDSEPKECMYVVALNAKNNIIGVAQASTGSLTSCPVAPRDIFREAIQLQAASIIIAHNHPSGDPTPSHQDIETTKQISKAGDILQITLLDHLIIGEHDYYSMRENGVIN